MARYSTSPRLSSWLAQSSDSTTTSNVSHPLNKCARWFPHRDQSPKPMSLIPIATRRTDIRLQTRYHVQMVSIPELVMRRRCPFCYYNYYQRGGQSYANCVQKHGCFTESLLWLELMDVMDYDWYEVSSLTPVEKLRCKYISSVPRYAQFCTYDMQDKNCNTQCVYYNDRLLKQQSVAKCSSSHKCGRNGSGFILLDFVLNNLYALPRWDYMIDDLSNWFTLSGKHLSIPDDYFLTNTGTTLTIYLNGTAYSVVNFIANKPTCGRLLEPNNSQDPNNWTFSQWLNPWRLQYYIPVISTSDQFYASLIERGVPASIF